MMKKNYYKGNKSLGTTRDFELGWFGAHSSQAAGSPMLEEIQKHREQFAAKNKAQS